jgi:hypothetical protein
MSSLELSCFRARGVCSRGYKLVGRGCRTQVPQNGVGSIGGQTLVTVALLSLLSMQGEEHKGNGDKSYIVWSLGRPFMCRCPSGRIETELCRLVVGAVV